MTHQSGMTAIEFRFFDNLEIGIKQAEQNAKDADHLAREASARANQWPPGVDKDAAVDDVRKHQQHAKGSRKVVRHLEKVRDDYIAYLKLR